MISIKEIIQLLGDDVIALKGKWEAVKIRHLRAPKDVDGQTLDWVASGRENKQGLIEDSPAKVFLVSKEVVYTNKMASQEKILICVINPKLAIASIASHFFADKACQGVHRTTVIDERARIGKNVSIGANSVINNCEIGDNVEIHSNVTIYDNTVVGSNVEIHSGAVIGSEAHNFVEDEKGVKVKFPHLGKVVIKEDVVIGANSVICRGVLENTVVGQGTKIAQHVLVGANVLIEKNCAIRGGAKLAGSVRVGGGATIGLGALVREKSKIGVQSIIGMGAVVTKDVPAGETWIGNPARKM